MSVALKLARFGDHKRPFYRIIVTEKHGKRDGSGIEIIGTYNPLTNPSKVTLKEDRVRHWLGCGAQPTQVLRDIIRKHIPNLIEEREAHQLSKIQEQRRKRKQRLKGKAAPKAKATTKKSAKSSKKSK